MESHAALKLISDEESSSSNDSSVEMEASETGLKLCLNLMSNSQVTIWSSWKFGFNMSISQCLWEIISKTWNLFYQLSAGLWFLLELGNEFRKIN